MISTGKTGIIARYGGNVDSWKIAMNEYDGALITRNERFERVPVAVEVIFDSSGSTPVI